MTISAKELSATSTHSEQHGPGRVLLVVNKQKLNTYGPMLEASGFTVLSALGGAAALIALRQKRPQSIIVDVDLKGISADELSKLLSQVKDGTQFILIGDDPATLARRNTAFTTGAFDYFQLPDEYTLLISRLTQLVKLKHTFDRLRSEADRDFLTGLANRRRFRAALGHELERWRRYKVSCALLIADLDYLKQINDKFGHPAGDKAIQRVAETLAGLTRENDTSARLGGEEFALLLASTDSQKAFTVAERLRTIVAATPVEDAGTVTVSLGIAACPEHAATERELYAIADAALYNAKRAGRNRTVIADGTMDSRAVAMAGSLQKVDR
jgi:diguanylate cyclase (GGDEF)-like protein